ncbi:MAG: hypothetical protein HOC09_29115 [Deltaproteobacteria bacterium]|jgi:trimethylamine---corrinoid protein Co-methyltransferase|nr:hypothetical protein [Deltaproteobacteria bacterium]
MNYSETPEIKYFSPPMKRKLLSGEQLEMLKNGTFRLLEEKGVHIPSKKALQIFADHGANVNFENQIVRISSDLVEKALSTAPRSFVLAGREKRFDLKLDGSTSYHIPTSCGVNFVDLKTREKRYSRKSDLVQLTRVFDSLPLFSLVRPTIAAGDCGYTSGIHECHADKLA